MALGLEALYVIVTLGMKEHFLPLLLGGLVVMGMLAFALGSSIARELQQRATALARVKDLPASVAEWRIRDLGALDVNILNLEVRFEGEAAWAEIASASRENVLRRQAEDLGLRLDLQTA